MFVTPVYSMVLWSYMRVTEAMTQWLYNLHTTQSTAVLVSRKVERYGYGDYLNC
jgi:archaellum component FlaF (FlaF/FlaG flagellin family)